jgi:hypothetical protein
VDAVTQQDEAWTLREQLEAEELQRRHGRAMAAPLREGEAVPLGEAAMNHSTGRHDGPGGLNLSTGKHSSTTRTTTTTVSPVSPAPLYEFYMYRANSAEGATKYDFGNINTANLDGVVWYLTNEVVTQYSHGTQCPRKFDISQINRYKIRTRATKELFETGVNFGVRWAYDFGMCMGRCFPGNLCTGQDDCDFHFDKFGGFNVGCNKFVDKYPFPDMDTPAKNGIWYALPLDGRCKGTPTGAKNCTWSYEEAGAVNLTDVEATDPSGPNCCADSCTALWDNPFDEGATNWRVQTIRSVFAEKFPDMPEDLGPSQCDFYKDAWYTWDTDTWTPKDLWADPDLWKKKGKPLADKGDGD